MNIEVLEQKLTSHIQESDRKYLELAESIKNIRTILEQKVSYKTFMLIFSILTGVLGYMIWQMDIIRDKTSITAEKVSAIETVFQSYNIEVKH